MARQRSICWFRQDLRLSDNPALVESARSGGVLPVYILDDERADQWRCGSAGRLWLHHSLMSLQTSLGGKLRIYRGSAEAILPRLCRDFDIQRVFWNRCYEPWRIARDSTIKKQLDSQGVTARSFNASLLREPWQILKNDGSPYKVFTPYFRRARAHDAHPVPEPGAVPRKLSLCRSDYGGVTVSELQLRPEHSWCRKVERNWQVGEACARRKLEEFIAAKLKDYADQRDFPARDVTSRLSPHLHFGEISPRQVWQRLGEIESDDNVESFKTELVWREFSYYLLYHFAQLPQENLKRQFDHYPWWLNRQWLERWQQGMTGYPFVDAGMRELWQTGFMHNRVRMITASFLVKNLLVHWHHGAAWFWDCLLDADLASNSASWQWVAGSGTDASPFFRIFNPVSQGLKFDPDGSYTKRYIPELNRLPVKYLFSPWKAPRKTLEQAGVRLGEQYPFPIVDLQQSRKKALDSLKCLP